MKLIENPTYFVHLCSGIIEEVKKDSKNLPLNKNVLPTPVENSG